MTSVVNRPTAPYVAGYRTAVAGANARVLRPATATPLRAVERTGRIRALATRRNKTVIAVAFLVIMIGRLFISVGIDANAYEIAGLAKESKNLSRDAAFIQEQLDVLNSPQHLSDVAQGLGMIANPRPAYLRISDGRHWGSAQVGFGGSIDRTQIANDLIDSLGVDAALSGVASTNSDTATAESKGSSLTTTGTTESTASGSAGPTGIPAPNTH